MINCYSGFEQISFPQRRRPQESHRRNHTMALLNDTFDGAAYTDISDAPTLLLSVNSTNCSQIFASTCVFSTTC